MVKYLRNLGFNVMNGELKDLLMQDGVNFVFDEEKMKAANAGQTKKPSEEPSTLKVE